MTLNYSTIYQKQHNYTKSQTTITHPKSPHHPLHQKLKAQPNQNIKFTEVKPANNIIKMGKNIRPESNESQHLQLKHGYDQDIHGYLFTVINKIVPEMQAYTAQDCLKRKIYENKFSNRSMQEIVKTFIELSHKLSSKHRQFINTFQLKMESLAFLVSQSQPAQSQFHSQQMGIQAMIPLIQAKINKLLQAKYKRQDEINWLKQQNIKLTEVLEHKQQQLTSLSTENVKLGQQLGKIRQFQDYCDKKFMLNITNILKRSEVQSQRKVGFHGDRNGGSAVKQMSKLKKDIAKHLSQRSGQYTLNGNGQKCLKARIDVLNRTVHLLQDEICGRLLSFDRQIKNKKKVIHELQKEQLNRRHRLNDIQSELNIKTRLQEMKQNEIRKLMDLKQTLKNQMKAFMKVEQQNERIGQGKNGLRRDIDDIDLGENAQTNRVYFDTQEQEVDQDCKISQNKQVQQMVVDTYQSQQQELETSHHKRVNVMQPQKHPTTTKKPQIYPPYFINPNNSAPSQAIRHFHLDILYNQDHDKQYLTQMIQQSSNRKIIRTNLLFRYDQYNHTPITKYVEDTQHFLLLVQTEHDYVIAFYSQKMISPKYDRNQNGKGMIISLTNHQVFYNVGNRRAAYYDDRYLIFGNSQARVCASQLKLFSNFGISNAYYDNGDENLYTIFGSAEKDIQLKHIQVYQILFED